MRSLFKFTQAFGRIEKPQQRGSIGVNHRIGNATDYEQPTLGAFDRQRQGKVFSRSLGFTYLFVKLRQIGGTETRIGVAAEVSERSCRCR